MSFSNILKLAMRMFLGLSHMHLRQHDEHGGTAAPSAVVQLILG